MRTSYFLSFLLLVLCVCACSPHPRRWQGQWQPERVQNRHLQRVGDALFILRLLGMEEAVVGELAQQVGRQLSIELQSGGGFECRLPGGVRLLRGRWRRRVLPRRLELQFSLPVVRKEKRLQLPVRFSESHMYWHNFDRNGSVIILKRKQ
ncbi:MAG: hypothetical protein KatS3mg033_1591 [Thermonema sp.]|uniref:hypothetical protein n=1 Tax=Thermonema sp. TaxID=2231181 RepID=UPI0021DD8185|nr:hypothetical protein [Thermonema sp.]GIV39791.1 MAG: hypothetical protein KatS3mg033_1591 [Thermonema sp.]